MPTPKTIQIFLPDGDAAGLRKAELTTRIVEAIVVPRSCMERFFARPESKLVCTYYLFGGSDEDTLPMAYIGQTEGIVQRLKSHDASKEFWNVAVVLISRTHSFTQAHIRWLEWKSIAVATEAQRYRLDNGNAGSEPYVTESIHADLEEIFETGALLLDTLGFPIFRPLLPQKVDSSNSDGLEMLLKGDDAQARGLFTSDGFVVRKGALCRKKIAPSCKTLLSPQRQRLLTDGILVDDGNHLVFARDHQFRSPSGAAALILGRSSNGWVEWKDSSDRTLKELKRQ